MESFDVLGDSELRATLLFVRGRADPPTADEAAAELDVARSVARWRLERLVEAGLLETAFVRRGVRTGPGAGRPSKTYAVVVETAAIEFPRRRYEVLLRLLVGAVPERRRAARLAEAGVEFGGELARAGRLRPAARLEAALDRICRALGTLGYQAAVESVSDGAAVIVTPRVRCDRSSSRSTRRAGSTRECGAACSPPRYRVRRSDKSAARRTTAWSRARPAASSSGSAPPRRTNVRAG